MGKHHFQTKAVITPEVKKESPILYVLEQQKIRTRQDLLRLRLAVDSAENPNNHDRQLLHDIYRELVRDPNLSANFNSRKMKTKTRAFKLANSAGEEDERTKLFQANWFTDFVDAALDSRLWGYSLIEFGNWNGTTFMPYQVKNKIYSGVNVIDRDNVKPEYGIITNTPGMNTGVSFDDPKYKNSLLFVGQYGHCLDSILFNATKYILFKDNCLGNWSEWAEVFGMDKRVGYTRTQNEDRKRFLEAIKNLGANSYGVFNEGDRVEYIGSPRTDAFKVYHELIKYVDSQVSKLVFGQDVVSNNTGQVVGEVGENVANMYGDSDGVFIERLVNGELFAFLKDLGVNLNGLTFQWDTTEKVPLSQRSEIDLRISQMGYKPTKEYIMKTYGTEVDEAEDNPEEIKQAIKNLYNV
jgi:phage gp29-like protein